MIKRIAAITFIFACSWVAWGYLSEVMDDRTGEAYGEMRDAVGGLWGTVHYQNAPKLMLTWTENVWDKDWGDVKEVPKSESRELSGSSINVDIDLDYRRKGLIWFSTYKVGFSGTYQVKNPLDRPVEAVFTFYYPSSESYYENMEFLVDGREMEVTSAGGALQAKFDLSPGQKKVVQVGYSSKGLDDWYYIFGEDSGIIKDFRLAMTTDFDDIDFPSGSISPDRKENLDGEGWKLVWEKSSMVSAAKIGMACPHRLNPGPLASAMSGHAPVSLLFFFFVIILIQEMRSLKIHPMNYFFLAASFFAFNLLFSYLVDHIDVKLAFAISSVVSISLVVSYLRLVVGLGFAIKVAGLSQLVYQVLFGVAHFFEGFTGLTITIGAIATLALVMHVTAKIDWEAAFKDKGWGKLPSIRKKAGADQPPPIPGGGA